MQQDVLVSIVDRMMVLPLMYRKLMKKAEPQNNIGMAQLNIMIFLDKGDKVPMYDIADKMSVSKPNLTPLVDKLCALGYVERFPGELDRRVTFIGLTEKGKKFIDEYRISLAKIIGSSFSSMSLQEQKKLDSAMDTIMKSLTSV